MRYFSILATLLILWSAPALAQEDIIRLTDEGVDQGFVTTLDCTGAGINCFRSVATSGRRIGTLNVGGGGSGAPVDATYWTGAANNTLTNEINLGALGTGLIINTAGTPSIYAGVTCTNQVLRMLTATGSGTCVTLTSAYVDSSIVASTRSISTVAPLSGGGDLSVDRSITTSMTTNKLIGRATAGTGVMEEITLGTNLSFTGTTLNAAAGAGAHTILSATHTDTLADTVLRGDIIRGNSTPAWSRLAVGGNNLYLKSNGTDVLYSTLAAGGVGGCTNQVATALNADAAPTCTTLTLASAFFANQGTTTTVLHGNGAGNPSFASVDLSADTTGTVPNTKGGTGQNSSGWSAIPLVTAGTWSQYGGVTCTNQVLTALSGSAAGTCTTITSAYTSGTFSATAHNLLSATHGDTTAASVVRGDAMRGSATATWERLALGGSNLYLKANATDLVYSTLAAGGVGSCTNQFVTALNADAAPTCTTDTLASAQHANQGTTTTVLHGNGAGNPSFAAVDLSADTTGTVPNTKGGTGQNSSGWSAIPLVTAGTWSQYAGVTCTNQVLTALSGSAAGTCTTITSAYVDSTITPSSRTISTVAPLSGGGDLTANRTITTSMTTARLLGRTTAATGVAEEISVTSPLTLSALALACPTCLTSAYTTVEDEGTPLTSRTNLNFTGAGVSCSDSGGKTVCTISANTVSATLDFGATGSTVAKVVVTGQAWVSTSSVIVCSPTMMATADRTDGMEDAVIEGLTVSAYARVAGTGFTIAGNPVQGKAYKKFLVHCTGV